MDQVEEEIYDEEAPLSADELFEQHKAEINAAFEEKGFFKRLSSMLSGLSKPHSSREYKLAKTELQRLAAPILAILLPVVGIIVLIVMTNITGKAKEVIQVEVAQAQEEEVLEEQEEEPEPEEVVETPPDDSVEVNIDVPSVSVSDVSTPTPVATAEPVSVKPAAQDSVAIIKSPVTMRSMTGSRTPGMIGRMTSGGGNYGDATTEGAVLKALRWLKFKQSPSGNWPGVISNTALAILTYLAHGETPASKEFGETVEKAIQYIIMNQTDRNGKISFNGVDGNEYATLICTYALCEAYGMTKNPNAKEAAMASLQRIIDNQSPTGGWDYGIKKESTRDDMSFEGWALQAVKAGKMAGLHPEGLDACIKKAMNCLKKRNFRGNGFNYTAGGGATGLTATGCLCMQLLGYGDQPEVVTSLETMRAWLPVFESKAGLKAGGPCPGTWPQYYCYYAAQCKYQAGMREGALPADVKSWQEWNSAMKKLYPSTIITLDQKIEGPDGKMHAMGYWNKTGSGDEYMATCLCALQLMVYYRYLPTTKVEKGAAKDSKKAEKRKKAEVAVEVDI